MATTSIRTAAKQALVSAIAAGFTDGTQVTYGWPGENIANRCVYVYGPHEASYTFPLMMSGRKQRDDIFVLGVMCFVEIEGDSLLEAEQAVEQLYDAVENVIAADQTLNNLDGVISVLLGPNVLGPNSSYIPEGAQASMTADVTIHSRLS